MDRKQKSLLRLLKIFIGGGIETVDEEGKLLAFPSITTKRLGVFF